MAVTFFKSNLDLTEKTNITEKLAKKTQIVGNCHIWTGKCNSSGYGFLKFTFRGRQIKCRVHRLAFFLRHNVLLMPNMHVSHLCHTKLCLRVEHLSYEPQRINNNRTVCKNEGMCYGHYAFPSCLL